MQRQCRLEAHAGRDWCPIRPLSTRVQEGGITLISTRRRIDRAGHSL